MTAAGAGLTVERLLSMPDGAIVIDRFGVVWSRSLRFVSGAYSTFQWRRDGAPPADALDSRELAARGPLQLPALVW